VRVGALEYLLGDDVVDLGVFARQPRLWIGNPALVAFAPCKPGWDLPLRKISGQVRLPPTSRGSHGHAQPPQLTDDDGRLRDAHRWCASALFDEAPEAGAAAEQLAVQLTRVDARLGSVIRRRLEAIAYRPEESLRAKAYRILLLDEPTNNLDATGIGDLITFLL
jgi:hypothetical protein